MIRIEILFDRQSTKNLKSGTLQALQNEIELRIPLYSITDWHRSPISDSHPFDQPGT
ncbi:hypothetical protein [Escherichia coli]|uniref:hypothetical protein n=1 Tax=Escherichia coli TaxID=562 RepID=UPI001FCEAE11|nr:hypothetical protein [Escherichia coli]